MFYSIVGALLVTVVAAVMVVAFSKRKKSLKDIPVNPPVGIPSTTG